LCAMPRKKDGENNVSLLAKSAISNMHIKYVCIMFYIYEIPKIYILPDNKGFSRVCRM